MKKFSPRGVLSNPVAVNSMIMFVGTMVTNFGAYLYQILIFQIMGKEKYGEFGALLSLLFLLSVPATVLQLVLTKYFSEYNARNEHGQTRTLYVKSLFGIGVVSIIGFLIYLPCVPFLQQFLHIPSFESFLYLYLIVVGSFFITCCAGLINAYQKFFTSSVNSIVLTAFRIISGIVFAPFGVAFALLGNAISNIISIGLFLFSSRFVLVHPGEPIVVKKSTIAKFAVPTLLITLGLTAFFNVDVILVKHFFDAAHAGIYASLSIFGKIVYFASSPISIVIFPMIIERKEQKKEYFSLFILGFIAVVIIGLGIVLSYTFFAHSVITVLFGKKFLDALPYLGSYGLFMAFVSMTNYLATACLAVTKSLAGILVIVGALVECVSILFFHTSISQVILALCIIHSLLALSLLVYYLHDTRHS